MNRKYLSNEIALVRQWMCATNSARNVSSYETTDYLLLIPFPVGKKNGLAVRIIEEGYEVTEEQGRQFTNLRLESNFVTSTAIDAQGAVDSIGEYLGL